MVKSKYKRSLVFLERSLGLRRVLRAILSMAGAPSVFYLGEADNNKVKKLNNKIEFLTYYSRRAQPLVSLV